MLLQDEKIKNTLFFLRELNYQIFEIFLLSYLIFYLLDDLLLNIVSNYFNLNIILIIVVASGIVSFLPGFKRPQKEIKNMPTWKDYIFIFILGLASCAIIFFKLGDLQSWLRLTISIISGIIIILISILLINENNEQEE